MSDKPSYLGLLNAIAVAERQAGEYLAGWAAVTPSNDVQAVIHTVALRETEHGLAFEKRIDELGLRSSRKPDPKHAKRMEIAASTKLSDREKFEQLGLGRRPQNGKSDVFDRFFENKDLDPRDRRPARSLRRRGARHRPQVRRVLRPALRRADKARQVEGAKSHGGKAKGKKK